MAPVPRLAGTGIGGAATLRGRAGRGGATLVRNGKVGGCIYSCVDDTPPSSFLVLPHTHTLPQPLHSLPPWLSSLPSLLTHPRLPKHSSLSLGHLSLAALPRSPLLLFTLVSITSSLISTPLPFPLPPLSLVSFSPCYASRI